MWDGVTRYVIEMSVIGFVWVRACLSGDIGTLTSMACPTDQDEIRVALSGEGEINASTHPEDRGRKQPRNSIRSTNQWLVDWALG
jgi:hypothetical protein